MPATIERQEALRQLRHEHREVLSLVATLSDEEMTRRDTIRYGLYADQECSFKDLLAHLVCYEVYALEAIEAGRAGRVHWAVAALRDPRRGREIHYSGIAERQQLSLAEQLGEYRGVSSGLEAAIAGLSDVEWREHIAAVVAGILLIAPRPQFRHLPVHIPDARRYIDSLRAPQRALH